jgi:hypothetical protein
MVISEEKKELLRNHFNEGNVIIEYGLNFLDGKTHYVSSIKELNAILDNSENYRYICCHELVPYDDIKDLLNDAKNHGPYVSKYNDYHNRNRYYLITSIHEVSTCIGVVLDGKHDFPVHAKELLKYYIWQDGERCGKLGKLIF